MIRRVILISFLLIPICLFGEGIKINILPSNNLSSISGKVNTVVIEIENITQDTIPTNIQFLFPEKWKAFQNNIRITLQPNQKIKKLLTFVIPHKAAKDKYEINFFGKHQQTGKVLYRNSFDFIVKGINKLEIVPMEVQPMSMAGAKIKGTFLVKNLSNQVQKILLVSNRGIIIGANTIDLEPFDNQIVTTEVQLPEDIRKESRFSFNLIGTIINTTVSSTANLHTSVLPTKDYFEKERHHLSAQFSANYILQKFDEEEATGLQGAFLLTGYLNKTATKYVEVSLRGPNRQGNAEILLYDEYYATYKSDKIQAKIGDHNFSLSRLTEFSRNARGIGLDLYFKEHSIGAFAILPRFFPDLKHETGFYFTNHFNLENSVSFNYLAKEYFKGKGNTSIISVSGLFTPFKRSSIEIELASGQGKGKEGYSGFLSFETKLFKQLNLKAQTILSSPHFDGYYRNTKNVSGNLNWNIGKNIQFFANASQDNRNVALDTLFQAAPYAQREQIGIQFRWNRSTYLQIAARRNILEDKLPTKFFNRKERLITARINNRYKYFGWSIEGEYGRFNNLLNVSERNLQTIFRTSLNLSTEFRQTHLNVFGNYHNENSLLFEGQTQFIYGASISTKLSSSNQLQVSYQNNYALEEYYRNRNTFNCSFVQKLWKGQQLSCDIRQTLVKNSLAKKDLTISLKYSWNFQIPLEARLPKGSVTGCIYREDHQPATGIVLYLNGKTAITDNRGKYEFKSLPQGTHFLMIDKSSLELHELTQTDSLIKVEVLPEVEQLINVKLIKTGRLLGSLLMKQRNAAPLLIKYAPLDNYLIEIRKGNEVRKTNTEENGLFSIKDLRPGIWTLTILNPNQNKRVIFNKTIFELEIKEKETTSFSIKTEKKERKIKFKKIINFSDDDDDGE